MSDPRLQNAMQLRRAGRLADAARIYGEILASEPMHFEALHALDPTGLPLAQTDWVDAYRRQCAEFERLVFPLVDGDTRRRALLLFEEVELTSDHL